LAPPPRRGILWVAHLTLQPLLWGEQTGFEPTRNLRFDAGNRVCGIFLHTRFFMGRRGVGRGSGKEEAMKPADVLRMIDAIHRERGVDREILFSALEEALSTATRKKLGLEEGIRFQIDRRNGKARILAEGGDLPANPDQLNPEKLGRIGAQTVKQVFMQKIREAERDKVYGTFESQVGNIVPGVVHKLEGPNVIINLGGKTEALLPRSERITSERLHVSDRVRLLIKEVRKEGSRVTIIVSRRDDDFVSKLFEVEVPEIAEGLVKVMAVARDPGYRCKVAVYSFDDRIDSIGACLGLRGTRIRNINDELGAERIDIIGWSDSLEELVQNALKPAKNIPIDHIFPDEETQSVFVLVDEDQKPLAIGVGGRNVRLASRLVGWDIEIKTPAEYEAELMAAEKLPAEGQPAETQPEKESGVASAASGDDQEESPENRSEPGETTPQEA